MSDDIKKFLDDVKGFPDSTEITIGDTKVPLGSLRSLNASERTALADKMKGLEGKEAELSDRTGKVVELAKKAQAAYDAAEEARKTAASSQRKDTDDWTKDPWLQPVQTEFQKRDKELADLKEKLTKALETVTSVATIGLEDRWDREFSSIDFGKREKKPTRQELLDHATKNNLMDRHKIPSIRAAWEDMSKADTLAEAVERGRQEGREEGRRETMAARVPPPGVSGPGMGAPDKSGKTPPGELGDLYSDALKDPELRALLEQAETHGIM